MQFEIRVNDELEGWDLISLGSIETEEGLEDEVIATFYSKVAAYSTKSFLES